MAVEYSRGTQKNETIKFSDRMLKRFGRAHVLTPISRDFSPPESGHIGDGE
jgi:hypothetical protein